jgi:tetratricopeptide (TPR) repeat protein
MQTAANKSFLDTIFSSKENLGIRCFPNYPKLYQQLAFGLIVNRATEHAARIWGGKLVAVAEHAYPIQDNETLKEAAELLVALPAQAGYRGMAYYYRGLYALRQREYDRAHVLFSRVIEQGSPAYRSRALVSLGRVYLREGDLEASRAATLEAARLASDHCRSALAAVTTGVNIAILDSISGDHRRALESLETLFPVAQMMGPQHPHEYYSYLNSLAVEMGEAGRFEEAGNIIGMVLRSPIALHYPELYETRDEIVKKAGRATWSVAAIGQTAFRPDNLLQLPAASERDVCHIENPFSNPSTGLPARVLKFKTSRKRIRAEATPGSGSDSDATLKPLSKKQKVIRIVDLITNNLTDDQLDKILSYVVTVAPDK